MAGRRKYRGGVNLWASAASAALHLCLLGALGLTRPGAEFSDKEPKGASVSIHQAVVKQAEPILTPVPKVRTEEVKKPVVQKPVEKPEPVIELVIEPVVQADAPAAEVFPKAAASAEPVESVSASLFGGRVECKRICYVVDCSGSMYGSFGRLVKELGRSIAGLADSQSFYVIFFRDGGQIVESGKGRFVRATMEAKSEAFSLINGVRPAGQTRAKEALRRACQIRDEQGKCAEVIYFLTDGFDLQAGGGGSFAKEIEALAGRLAPGAVICTVGLWSRQQDKGVLRELAEATGGRFIDIDISDGQ